MVEPRYILPDGVLRVEPQLKLRARPSGYHGLGGMNVERASRLARERHAGCPGPKVPHQDSLGACGLNRCVGHRHLLVVSVSYVRRRTGGVFETCDSKRVPRSHVVSGPR